MSAVEGQGSAAARGESVIVLAGMLYRAYGLVVMLAVVLLGGGLHAGAPMLWFTAAVVAESLAVIAICLRRRVVGRVVMAFDVGWMSAALFAAAILVRLPADRGWIDYMYTYSLVTSVAIGFAFHRYLTVLGLTVLLVTAYLLSDTLIQHIGVRAALSNALSYFINTGVSWVVARYLRRLHVQFDASRVEALARAEALAKERERLRHARMLHDRVLQTLETLATGDWIRDRDFHWHIRAEAAWLRALVEGADPDQTGDLLAGLQRLVSDKASTGLRVEFNSVQLREPKTSPDPVPAPVVYALVDAANEALTNVAKHSGLDSAIMRAEVTGDHVTVSILDHGRGFDPAGTSAGIGLAQSIRRRIEDVGGTATVDSSPGAGTYVELTVPLPP